MDANEEMAVKIVRDCLTTARESLPPYVSRLWVREMPKLEFVGTSAAGSVVRHALIAAFRVAAMRSTYVDLASDFAPDVRITRVRASCRRVSVYCETNTGYVYKVVCVPLWDTTVSGSLPPCPMTKALMAKVGTCAFGDAGWNTVMCDYVDLV
jgi:hypothetical protein